MLLRQQVIPAVGNPNSHFEIKPEMPRTTMTTPAATWVSVHDFLMLECCSINIWSLPYDWWSEICINLLRQDGWSDFSLCRRRFAPSCPSDTCSCRRVFSSTQGRAHKVSGELSRSGPWSLQSIVWTTISVDENYSRCAEKWLYCACSAAWPASFHGPVPAFERSSDVVSNAAAMARVWPMDYCGLDGSAWSSCRTYRS